MPSSLITENINALDRYERGLAGPLARIRARFGEYAIRLSLQQSSDLTPLRVAFQAEVFALLKDATKKTIAFFNKLTLAEIETRDAKNDFEQIYSMWVNTRLFEHSAIIAETAVNDVYAIVQAVIAEGGGDVAVAKAIRDYSSASKWQARMIARTETHQAAMYAKSETAQGLQRRTGIEMVKFWNAVEDLRTRPEHSDAEIKYKDGIKLDEKFIVAGDAMDRPGDPSASASNIINCRCVVTMRPKGF